MHDERPDETPAGPSALSIIGWWELRRILYNIILLLSLQIALSILNATVTDLLPGEDVIEPFAMAFLLLLANAFYTVGWVIDITVEPRGWLGPILFKWGTIFSVGVVMLPPMVSTLTSLTGQ